MLIAMVSLCVHKNTDCGVCSLSHMVLFSSSLSSPHARVTGWNWIHFEMLLLCNWQCSFISESYQEKTPFILNVE